MAPAVEMVNSTDTSLNSFSPKPFLLIPTREPSHGTLHCDSSVSLTMAAVT